MQATSFELLTSTEIESKFWPDRAYLREHLLVFGTKYIVVSEIHFLFH
jgi:hypothetical protein